MRYCYARLLSVGNPSGPVKFSGQPQYDSEQVVSPLFTFSAPPMAAEPPPANKDPVPEQLKDVSKQELYLTKQKVKFEICRSQLSNPVMFFVFLLSCKQ